MKYSDEKIIEKMRSPDNTDVFKYLYNELYKPLKKYILNNNGKNQDVEDVLQKGLIIFWENVIKEKYVKREDTKITTYIQSICRFQWLNHLKRNKPNKIFSINDIQLSSENEENEDDEDKKSMIQKVEEKIKQLSETCQKIISFYYYYNMSLKEIALKLNYSNERSAITQKFKCMKKLTELVKN